MNICVRLSLSAAVVRRGAINFLTVDKNLYMNFIRFSVFFLKSLFSSFLPQYTYFIIILLFLFEVVVFADKVKRERERGDKSATKLLLLYSQEREGFMNWTRKPPSERAHLHQTLVPMCVHVQQITIKCLTYLIHYPSKCNPLALSTLN